MLRNAAGSVAFARRVRCDGRAPSSNTIPSPGSAFALMKAEMSFQSDWFFA